MANFFDSGFSGLTGLFGGLFGASSASKEAQKNRDFQSAEAEKARKWQSNEWTRQFNLTNQYNAPTEQMKRFAMAGLNPNLIYGSIVNGSASPTTPGTPIPTGSDASSAVGSNISSAFQSVADIPLRRAQIENIEADTEKKLSDAKLANSNKDSVDFHTQLQKDLRNFTVGTARNTYLNGLQDNEIKKVFKKTQDVQLEILEDGKKWLGKKPYYDILYSVSQMNALDRDAEYKAEAKRLLGYNAETNRISANASYLSASSYSFLVPYLAQQAVSTVNLNNANANLANVNASYQQLEVDNYLTNRVAVSLMQSYDLYKKGQLNEGTLNQILTENLNLEKYGNKEPNKGGFMGTGFQVSWLLKRKDEVYNKAKDFINQLFK